MVRYLFLGLQYNNERESEYLNLSKHGLSAASNELQWNLCDGFVRHLEQDFEILTALPVGCYPKHFRKIRLENQSWEYCGVSVNEIGSWNLPVLKQLERARRCADYIQKWINKNPDDQHVVILYSLYLPYLKAIQKVKRSYTSLRSIIIVPDLPGKYGILPNNYVKARIAASAGYKAMKIAESFDGYVVLTEQMTKPLNIGNKPYVVVEGVCSEKQITTVPENEKVGKPYFFYAGSLKREFGIMNLLDAFEMMDDTDAELWICGAGDMENEIKERSAKNPRIRFLGFRTKDEVRRMQQNAVALVNPRTSDGVYTQYSFPSKTIEYMASGTPVVMNRLPGIPTEYDEYLFYPEDSSALSLAKTIKSVLDMEEKDRIKFGKRASNFILTEKNAKAQAEKILNLIND
ncbi:MAG: glycosyltransferase [Clostridia bacterium]|nr:glycosyltransferase [Clostridia bacterium]